MIKEDYFQVIPMLFQNTHFVIIISIYCIFLVQYLIIFEYLLVNMYQDPFLFSMYFNKILMCS